MINKNTRLLTAIATLLFVSFSHSAPLPEKFTSVYEVKTTGLTIGETKRTLTRKDGQYQFESITRPKGLAKMLTSGQVVERSMWNYFQGKPRPEQYTFFNSGSKKKRKTKIRFDWNKNQVVNIINGEPWSMPLEFGTQDKLLYQLRIMYDLPTDKARLRYPIADGGKLKHYDIEVVGKERVRIDMGKFDTIRLRYVRGSRTTTLWCAEKLGYLPVRIQQQKNDESPVIATLISVSGLGPVSK